ncbi:MAG: hypothetical protein QOH93_593 [Chloroflexia bacterium]|jgi:hypothetical protein|nr:hypothetical protein [Chloroflexia bacterium]
MAKTCNFLTPLSLLEAATREADALIKPQSYSYRAKPHLVISNGVRNLVLQYPNHTFQSTKTPMSCKKKGTSG